MAKNTKHVGLLLFACVKLFLFIIIIFASFLESVFGLDQGLGEGRRMPLGPPAAIQGPSEAPRAAQTSRSGSSGSGAGGDSRVRWAFGRGFPSRLIVLTLGRSPPPAAVLRFTTPTPGGPRLLPSPELSPAL